LLEETLQRFGREDNPVTSKILGALSRSLGITGDQRAMVYAEQAVAMARRLDDPELIAHGLHGMFFALTGPQHAAQRLSVAKEMYALAHAAAGEDTTELEIEALWSRSFALLETGDVAAADADNEEMRRFGEETNRPFTQSLAAMFGATRAAMLGRFEDSERLAQQALAFGQRMETEAASGIFGIQMFAVRREQGRLKEVEPVVRVFLQQHSADGAWRPGLAVIFSDLGLVADARAEFDILAEHDFADLPLDGVWMGTMTFLVDVCTFLQDSARAETLYRKLIPFAGLNAVVSNSTACYGAVSRYLGALSTTLERWDDAARHFEDALAMNARMDARTWLAHTQQQYATMLLARNNSGDREKAIELLDAALATTRELGMRALEERITAAQSRMKAELN
jgi:tetratricopeptide (TPR) repeat protein